MERQLWKQVLALLKRFSTGPFNARHDYSDEFVVRVWFWAVVHDRPVSWACVKSNWDICDRRRKLPSNSTMSRRLRSATVRQLIEQVEKHALQPNPENALCSMVDGKPLVISGHSKDPHAGYGRAVGGKAKGYKIHAIVGADDSLLAWRLAPMNTDERVMARRMLRDLRINGYLIADANYDSNKIHQDCDDKGGLQLVCPRRGGPGRGLGNHRHAAGRLRSKDILESPCGEFGKNLMIQRVAIERFFGNLTNWGGGLTCLPTWARTYRRVHRWVQAKLILNALR